MPGSVVGLGDTLAVKRHAWSLHPGERDRSEKVKMNRRITKCKCYTQHRASLATQMVKNLSAMQETWVRVLAQEDPLEKEMATSSSNLAWRIPWTEEPGVTEKSHTTG